MTQERGGIDSLSRDSLLTESQEFAKLLSVVEAKIVILSDVVCNVNTRII